MSAGRVGRRSAALAVLAVVLLGAACGDSIVGTETFGSDPCTLPPTSIPASAVGGLELADVRVAVLDAAERMTAALPAGGKADELRITLGSLASEIDAADPETGCRIIHAARAALDAHETTPATRADLAGLRLVLDLATAALASSP